MQLIMSESKENAQAAAAKTKGTRPKVKNYEEAIAFYTEARTALGSDVAAQPVQPCHLLRRAQELDRLCRCSKVRRD